VPGGGDGWAEVIGVSGRLVRTIKLPAASGGLHKFLWDGKDDAGRTVGSGLYLLRVCRGDESQVTRFTKVR
jgi:flagellar hook assembly protein FlgD